MNEEEKEAIEVLKEMQEICKHKTYIENEERSEWQREYKAIDTILNYIDKLKKENEDLKLINSTLNETYNSIEKRNNFLQKELLEIENELKNRRGDLE